MKKNKPVKRPLSKNQAKSPAISVLKPKDGLKISHTLLLLGYVLLPIFTPNFYILDTAGAKFLAISILNIISFLVFLSDGTFRKRQGLNTFYFRNAIAIVYSIMLILALLSFTQAINLNEALLNFSKAFTIFTAVYLLFVIFSSNRKYFNFIALVLTLTLLFDGLTVVYHMLQYMAGTVDSIYDIKLVYSHRNILASALFVKLPSAMYLMFFTKGWQKILGYATGIITVLATLLLATRAFYVGMVLLVIGLIVFAILRFIAVRKKSSLIAVGIWVGIFVLAVVTYILAQQLFFTRSDKVLGKVVTVKERISSIRSDESSVNARLTSWKRSVRLIKENPWLGVGTGNWKVRVLKYENPTISDYIYMFKNHNDFLEITAETGIFGGIAFISIFLLIILGFARSCLASDAEDSKMKLLFLPAFGMLVYAVDAFFNFPADRPEIQALFAFYVGLAISAYSLEQKGNTDDRPSGNRIKKWNNKLFGQTVAVVILLVLFTISYLLFLNVRSLRFQRFVKEDLAKNKLEHPASMIIAGFPSFPDLTVDGEPVAVNKARYLLNEEKYREAIKMLLADHSSPWDSRREYFLSMGYQNLGMLDSAQYYIRLAHQLKPRNPKAARVLSSFLWEDGQKQDAILLLDTLLQKVKNNSDAWVQAVNYQLNEGNDTKALMMLDTAVKYLPADTTLASQRKRVDYLTKRKPLEGIYSKAIKAFREQQYSIALVYLNEFISKQPGLAEAYQMRSYCHYYGKSFEKSLNDINQYLAMGEMNYYLLNLRGINLRALGRMEEACNDFKAAMDNGNPDGASNYKAYCMGK